MNIAIIGSRTFTNYTFLEEKLLPLKEKITCIVSGGAKGADTLAEEFAKKYNIPTKIFLPDRIKFGRLACQLRNTTIIENCEMAIAFWDGQSKGTLDAITKCKAMAKEVILHLI